MPKYIYDYASWPNFSWKELEIQNLLGQVRHLQGKLLGQMDGLGFSVKEETMLSTLTADVVKSSEIEGEKLNDQQVRSSIARRLGIEYAGMIHFGRDVEGVVEMMIDATHNYQQTVDDERLFGWHAALFPTGRSGMFKIDVGSHRTGDMQVISGAMGKERLHYQAPSPDLVPLFMTQFLDWFNTEKQLDPVLKAAIAHFWFIIIHPFDDGNGRIARALSDLLLARADDSSQRYYSLSSQILLERTAYYEILKKTQHSQEDITPWLNWFLSCLLRALNTALQNTGQVLRKAAFWDKHQATELNSRQRLMINKLLDGFDGKLKTSKWAKIAKCSSDTALRDVKDLLGKHILRQEKEGGRSTNYELEDW